ncbi:sugar transferase [Pelagicoccus sp. SDUM812003]|uniref:sugar transferase n=1 Tax=Pelagicoccus sp. SDUM812003 TaxID=3041267 RepID=UPI00280F514C|nr:sugar transferase [Pelagicoccus sp. SDUM812003]MDQ8203433.1 sugar transferase [Pelagicoccus sp. SDUM812003]
MQPDLHQQDKDLVDYWTKAGTASGKARLRFRMRSKRLVWNSVLAASLGLKRVIDIVASGCALLLLSPVYAATALLIKLEDRGPIFFKQERIGYRGQRFYMWKFRSMVVNADKLKDQLLEQNEHKGNNVTFKMKRDPRITRIGRFIRKYSVDELPQFWNVFKGEMSIVGPRPCVPREVVMYSVEDRKRLLAKPGLTCFWQVAGRADINFEGQVRLDVEYIRSESVWLDLKLLFLTIPAVLLGKGAY